MVAGHLRGLASPDEAVFYTSGKTSNEAAFAYQLFVRAFGTNNLPDCSNMCHESTSVGLAETIGIGKGSVSLEDVHHAELIVIAGQNPGTNHPRMLSALELAKKNGARIIAVNPLREAGLVRFRNPQTPRGWVGPGHGAGRPAPADPAQRRPRAVPGDRLAAGRVGRRRPRLRGAAHDRLRRVGRARRRPRLGRRTPRDGPHPRAGRGDRRDVPRLAGHRHLLGDGDHPAPQRGRHGQGVRQRRAAPGQHRQAGCRPVPGARPLQRPGRPDHGDLGAAQAGVPRRPAERVRLRPAARGRLRHGRGGPGAPRRPGPGVLRDGRQLRLGGVRHRRHRGRDAAGGPDRARLDQAQQVARRHRPGGTDPAGARPQRAGPHRRHASSG